MFDNICSLPLPSEVFAQAIHPREPVFTVGLSSGHVKIFRLPSVGDEAGHSSTVLYPQTNAGSKRSSLSSSSGRRLSETGLDTITSVWETRRHKGSCRALAFSADGASLFSTGTDGIVKIASAETGRVISKFAIPAGSAKSSVDAPSILSALSAQTILLGTDTGRLHVYDVRTPVSELPTTTRPVQTLRPHVTPDDPSYSEPLTSMTALTPTNASTSGTSRSWITTSGSSLAVSDLRKGIVSVSADQGDVLLSSACCAGLGVSQKKRRLNGDTGGASSASESIIVGGAQGALMVWDRDIWADRRDRIMVHRSLPGDDDGTIDALAVVPEELGAGIKGPGTRTVAVGIGTGEIKFVRLRGGNGELFSSVRHDETGVDGVATLGFDVEGRLISGGGQLVKVWHRNYVRGGDAGEAMEEEDPEGDNSDEDKYPGFSKDESDVSSIEDDDSDEPRVKHKKRKKGKAKAQHGHHGIAAFAGID